MSEHGIIMSAPMVQALLAGRKTQTRRLATSPLRRCVAGDQLWVRECGNWKICTEVAPNDGQAHGFVWYAADGDKSGLSFFGGKMRPSIHMPRWASRLTLTLIDVRIQSLQALTDEDAIAEGIVEHETCGWHVPGLPHPLKEFPILSRSTPREMYAALWDTLHGSGEWLGNPDVVALTFEIQK